MKSLRTFLLGFSMFSLCAPLVPANAQVESDGGLYWSMRGGLSEVRNITQTYLLGSNPEYETITDIDGNVTTVLVTPGVNDHRGTRKLKMDDGWLVGGAIGYTWLYPENSADLRLEIEGTYRRSANGTIEAILTPISNRPDSISYYDYTLLPFDGTVSFRSAMINMFLDFHTPTRVVPYIGLGAGMTQLVSKVGVINDDLLTPSWQAIGGIGYKLSPGTMLTMEYRFFQLAGDSVSDLFQTKDLASIEFEDWSMGVRLTF